MIKENTATKRDRLRKVLEKLVENNGDPKEILEAASYY